MSIIFVFVLYLTTYSVDKSDAQTDPQNLCHQKGLKILSIFNLKFNTFIQSIDGNGNVDFWRIFVPQYYTNGNSYSDNSYDDIIPKEVQNHYSDHNMTKILKYELFDIEKPIFGYIIPINEQLLSRCPQQENQTVENPLSGPGCQILEEVFNSMDQHFVCFHGKHKRGWDMRWFLIYQSEKGILSQIDSTDLRDELIASHTIPFWGLSHPLEVNLYDDPHILFFINWEDYSGNWNNISIFEYKKENEIQLNVAIRVSLTIDGQTLDFVETDPRAKRYFVFRFNDYYKFLYCGQNCTLDSRLTWNEYNHSKGSITPVYKMGSSIYNEPFLTIRKLLLCKPKTTRFEPNQFCDSRQHFISIFNLGNDIYFQRSGLFWRYLPTGFTIDAIPDSNLNISPIRLDSGTGEILQRDNFDTTQPIFGFTFKAPVLPDIEMCDQSNYEYDEDVVKCNKFYTESDNYFRSCLYGKQIKFQFKTAHIYNIVYAYQYTPSGLRNFDKSNVKIFDETLDFCYDLFMGIKNEFIGYNINSIINPGSYRDYLNQEINRIFLLMDWDKGNGDIESKLMALYWKFNTSLKFNLVTKEVIKEKAKLPKFFFSLTVSLGLTVYGYGLEMNGNLYEFVDIFRNIGSFETNVVTTLSQLFKCPFNSSTSLLTAIEIKQICEPPHSKDLNESVFTIGDLHYHQMGQYFYAFNKKYDKFFYDRYTTDLLNDYFETTERVTGYTVPLNKIIRTHQDVSHTQTFVVIIYGRSRFSYRELGEYIFAMFKIDDNIAAKLTAINGINTYSFATKTTLGNKCPLTQDKRVLAIHSQISLPRFYNDINFFLIFVIENQLKFDFYLTFSTNESFFGLGSDFNKEIYDYYSFEKTDIKDEIIGIHPGIGGPSGHFLFLVHRRNDTQELVQNTLGNYSTDNIEKGFVTFLKKGEYALPQNVDYKQTFCSKVPQHPKPEPEKSGSDSNSDSSSASKTLTFILAIFVLILLIIALFVGLINYFSNQKVSKQPNQPINTMKAEPSVDTLEPNRPNYTVIRQPDPIVDKSESERSQMSIRSDEI